MSDWGEGAAWEHERVEQPHEATLLTLDSARARQQLAWSPRIGYRRGIQLTVDWYKAFARRDDVEAVTLAQIDSCLAL